MVAAVVDVVAAARQVDTELRVDGRAVAAAPAAAQAEVDSAVVDAWGPWLPGFVREALTSPSNRRGLGVHHTPPSVVEEILDLVDATGDIDWSTVTVLDPSVGGGAFLLAAAARMHGDRAGVVRRLAGVDVDPLAVGTTVTALSLWAGEPVDPSRVLVGDFLDPSIDAPRTDVVVGNPPFLSQLRGGTGRTADERARLAARWPGVGRYVDDAVAFLLASVEHVGPDGTVALVQPSSMLGALDARAARRHLAEVSSLTGLWVDRSRRFEASVDTVAVVMGRSPSGLVRVGTELVDPPSDTSWAPLLAASTGTPAVSVDASRLLGEIAVVTAGFRDQFYGLRGAVFDDPDGAHPLITSGSVDPLALGWGERTTRFDKASYRHPCVDVRRVAANVRPWVEARLVPKVLVASQTKVIEAVVDERGVMVPGTPVVSVEPHEAADLWRLAALLTSPVATALIGHAAAGTALSSDAVRVSARLLAALPLPVDEVMWSRAADRARAGEVTQCGRLMLRAHGLGDRSDILDWWVDRIPTRSLGN
ncbi:MAG: N-6 DNA methylase [Actinomycetota bacterium]